MTLQPVTVPFLDLHAATAELAGPIEQAVLRVTRSGYYIGGPETEAFEAEFAEYTGAACCVGTGNGLDALELALRAMGVGPGDEVIVPSNTYIATWLAVSAVGARPVPVEPDPATHNIDPARIEAALSARTRVILPVHLYGQPADLAPILALAKHHGLRVLEDAAQAQGATWRGRRIGSHGDAVCWSFYPGKNLGALGDAGAVTTSDPEIAAEIRRLGNYGSSRKYICETRGTNSRLDPIQAAVLRVKLAHLDAWNDRRRAAAAVYLAALPGLGLGLPSVLPDADPVWHQFVVRSSRRDELQHRLAGAGIATLIHYPVAPHMQEAYADLGLAADDLPIARDLSREVLSLPIGPHLTREMQDRVIDALLQQTG